MKTYLYTELSSGKLLEEVLRRPSDDLSSLEKTVTEVMEAVKSRGDDAVIEFNSRFDGCQVTTLEVSERELEEASAAVPEGLKKAIRTALKNIRTFHSVQLEEPQKVETMPGVCCWRKSVPIENVGLYIPGGTAPLFSTVLMLAGPARLAGCENIFICTPAGKDGKIDPAILFAAREAGVSKVFRAGGVQGIAAMTYGTKTVPRADKIFGPGNRYVTLAKQLANRLGVAIDMPAGPSEVAVIADDSCVPSFVAADLLSQAEHGTDSQVLLLVTSADVLNNVKDELARQLSALPRADIASKALQNSVSIVTNDLSEAMDISNRYAPEHLILQCRDAADWAARVKNAGSVFIGHFSPESAGDYASGTNHTLPTNGFARAFSGVSLDSFMKKITFQQLEPAGLMNLAETIETMAAAEGLDAHKNAVTIRKEYLKNGI